MKKLLLLFVVSTFVTLGSLEALTVLPPRTSAGDAAGKAFAEGFRQGMEDGAEEAYRQRQRQQEMEMQRQEEERCNRLIRSFIDYYDPANHSKCISTVLQSRLPNQMKQLVIDHLNKAHEEYLKNK